MTAEIADLQAFADVLARHYRESTGMTQGSPDRCACGATTRPAPGDEDVTVRRARAFGYHQAVEVITASLRDAADAEAGQ